MIVISFSYFINLEVLALVIIDEHIDNMTNSNICYDTYAELDICDEAVFHNNLKNGWVVVSMLSNYVESAINTILRDCILYDGERLLKSNVEDKLEIIYPHYKADTFKIKEKHYWGVFRKLSRIRNELTHFKKNYIGTSGFLPTEWIKPFGNVGEYFTKDEMIRTKDDIIKLCNEIASDCKLEVNRAAKLFNCYDACDFPYIYDPKEATF